VTSQPDPFEIEGADGGPLRGDYWAGMASEAAGAPKLRMQRPAAPEPAARQTAAPCVAVISHGYRGYKDWGLLLLVAQRVAAEGIPAVTFNFGSSGITDREGTFGEPERFRKGTYGDQLDDLDRVIEWAVRRVEPSESGSHVAGGDASGDATRSPRVGLIGHSRGGALSILHAASDPRVRCVAALASPSRIGVWPDPYYETWKRGEPVELHDFRTKARLRLGPELYQDFVAQRARYDVLAAVESLRAPLLLVQGDRDRSVTLEEAHELRDHAPPSITEYREIAGEGHNFSAGDKIRRTPPQLLDVVELVAAWMRRWLIASD